jgi:ribosome assembly protein SQT1
MATSNPLHDDQEGPDEQDIYIDPNDAEEEYADEHHADDDQPMSEGDEDDEVEQMEDDEIFTDDSIQGFFLHTSPVYSVALHENYAVTGGGDDLGFLWDITNGEMIMKLDGHTDSVTNVAFSNDGTYLATGGMDGQVRIWSVQEKKLVVALEAGDEVLVLLSPGVVDNSG